jgi:hypothetical protein
MFASSPQLQGSLPLPQANISKFPREFLSPNIPSMSSVSGHSSQTSLLPLSHHEQQATLPIASKNTPSSKFLNTHTSDEALLLPEPTFSLEDIESAQMAATAFATSAVTAEIILNQQLAQQQHVHHLESLQSQLLDLVARQEKVLKLQEQQLRQQPVQSSEIRSTKLTDQIQNVDAAGEAFDHQVVSSMEINGVAKRSSAASGLPRRRQQAAIGSSRSSSSNIPTQPRDVSAAQSWADHTITESLSQVLLLRIPVNYSDTCTLFVVLVRMFHRCFPIFGPVQRSSSSASFPCESWLCAGSAVLFFCTVSSSIPLPLHASQL